MRTRKKRHTNRRIKSYTKGYKPVVAVFKAASPTVLGRLAAANRDVARFGLARLPLDKDI